MVVTLGLMGVWSKETIRTAGLDYLEKNLKIPEDVEENPGKLARCLCSFLKGGANPWLGL